MEKYAEDNKMPNLQDLSNELCEDEEIEYVKLPTKQVASLEKIDIGENTSILTKLKEYPYEFEINSLLQLSSIDGIKIANNYTEQINDLNAEIEKLKKELDKANSTTATETEILEGYTAYKNGKIITGTLNKNEVSAKKVGTITKANESYTFQRAGYIIGTAQSILNQQTAMIFFNGDCIFQVDKTEQSPINVRIYVPEGGEIKTRIYGVYNLELYEFE